VAAFCSVFVWKAFSRVRRRKFLEIKVLYFSCKLVVRSTGVRLCTAARGGRGAHSLSTKVDRIRSTKTQDYTPTRVKYRQRRIARVGCRAVPTTHQAGDVQPRRLCVGRDAPA
jgi:hypothetical protein